MRIVIKPFIGRPGLYTKFLIRLHEAHQSIPGASKKEYLDFKTFNLKICRTFSLSKTEAFDILKLFENLCYVTFVKYRGFKLNYEVRDK